MNLFLLGTEEKNILQVYYKFYAPIVNPIPWTTYICITSTKFLFRC